MSKPVKSKDLMNNVSVARKATKPNKRHQARVFALQALYHSHFSDESPEMIAKNFLVEHANDFGVEINLDLDFYHALVLGTLKNRNAIDQMMSPFLDRSISQLNPVELSALRLGIDELQFHPEVPPSVVINEAIELTKEFGSQDGYKFVNAVLNAFIKSKT